MQPFTAKTGYTLVVGAIAFFLTLWLLDEVSGIGWIFLRSFVFLLVFLAGVVLLKLTPDLQPVMATLRKKLKTGN